MKDVFETVPPEQREGRLLVMGAEESGNGNGNGKHALPTNGNGKVCGAAVGALAAAQCCTAARALWTPTSRSLQRSLVGLRAAANAGPFAAPPPPPPPLRPGLC